MSAATDIAIRLSRREAALVRDALGGSLPVDADDRRLVFDLRELLRRELDQPAARSGASA